MPRIKIDSVSQRMIRIAKEGWNATRKSLDKQVLSNIQYNICFVVFSEPGISQDGIAKSLYLDKSSVAKLIAKLMDMGYIRREVNQDDRRKYHVYLTESGEVLLSEFVEKLAKWEDDVFGEVGSIERDQFDQCLSKLESKVL